MNVKKSVLYTLRKSFVTHCDLSNAFNWKLSFKIQYSASNGIKYLKKEFVTHCDLILLVGLVTMVMVVCKGYPIKQRHVDLIVKELNKYIG